MLNDMSDSFCLVLKCSAMFCFARIFQQICFSSKLQPTFFMTYLPSQVVKVCKGFNTFRSSRPEVFCKKGVPRDFSKFTRKHLCQRLFFNQAAGLSPQACNFIKKKSLAQMLSCELCKISKHTFFTKHLRWVFLYFDSSSTFN